MALPLRYQLLLAVTIAVSSVTSALPEGGRTVEQASGPLKLAWDTSLDQQRYYHNEHSTSPASSNFPPASSTVESDQYSKPEGSWNYELNSVSFQSKAIRRLFENMVNSIANNHVCHDKHDCTAEPGTTCCWIPNNSNANQCIKEVTEHGHRRIVNYLEGQKFREEVRSSIEHSTVLFRTYAGFNVLVLPVGQGDCVAMYCPNGNLVMFDCGSRQQEHALTGEEVKGILMLESVKKVTIFVSHGHIDHYKHLPTVFDDLTNIDRVIIGGHPADYEASKAVKEWMQDLADSDKLYAINDFMRCIGNCNDKLHTVKYQSGKDEWIPGSSMTRLDDMDICGSADISFDIIAANVRKEVINEKSIVLKVSAKKSVLLSGDIEGGAAEAVAAGAPNSLKSDIFQISHHGASTKANKLEWLHVIQPKQAFVSHAYGSYYGHPRCEAIRNLMSIGSVLTDVLMRTHQFMCTERRNVRYSGEICHDIFSTSPAEGMICSTHFSLELDLTLHQCYSLLSGK